MKVKNKLKYDYGIFLNYISTQKFMIIFLLAIVFAFLGSIDSMNYSFTSALNLAFNSSFYMGGILLLILLNTKCVYDMLVNNYNYAIRSSTKNEYLKRIIGTTLFNNFFLFSICIILLLIFVNIFGGGTETLQIKSYTILPGIYLIFTFLKFIIIFIFITVINILLFKIINNKVLIILNILYYLSVNVVSLNFGKCVESIFDMHLSLNYYIYSLFIPYSNFLFEICCTCLYFFLLYFVCFILYKFLRRTKR